jgi:hypothetical protein
MANTTIVGVTNYSAGILIGNSQSLFVARSGIAAFSDGLFMLEAGARAEIQGQVVAGAYAFQLYGDTVTHIAKGGYVWAGWQAFLVGGANNQIVNDGTIEGVTMPSKSVGNSVPS